MSPYRHRWATAVPTLIALLVLSSACSHSTVKTQQHPSASTAVRPTPTSTIDPHAQPAVTAYEAFARAADQAQLHPVSPGDKWPPGGDFTKVTFDPFRAEFEGFIWNLTTQGVEYRGTPDTAHVSVKSIQLDAKPWPTVFLTDCETGGTWDEYVIKTGKRVPLAGNGNIPPPYLITGKMIYYQHHWGLQSTTADKSRTCTA